MTNLNIGAYIVFILLGIVSSGNLRGQSVVVDSGDLPSSYGTASHQNGTGDLFMGAMVDYESTVVGSDDYSAMADNNDGSEDEDALLTKEGSAVANILLSIDQESVMFRLNIACTNSTGAEAILGAWIDFNCNEEFEEDEYAYATVPSDHIAGEDIELQWGSIVDTSDSPDPDYLTNSDNKLIGDDDIESIALRLRLAPSLNANDFNDDTNGAQLNGEVEDYWLPVACICGNGTTDIWYFGYGLGLDFGQLTSSPETGYSLPSAIFDGKTEASEGATSVSNACGEKLLYSDGKTVWNTKHEVLDGMENLITGNHLDLYTPAQTGLLLKVPFRNDLYYLFTSTAANDYGLAMTSVIDMTKNRGLGGVSYGVVNTSPNLDPDNPWQGDYHIQHHPAAADTELKIIRLPNLSDGGSPNTIELLSAIEMDDKKGYWVICHGGDSGGADFRISFMIGKLTVDGIKWETQSAVGNDNFQFDGFYDTDENGNSQLKFTPNGDQFAVTANGCVYLYDFDNVTGEITNERLLIASKDYIANTTNNTTITPYTPYITIPTKDITGSKAGVGTNPTPTSDSRIADDYSPFTAVDWLEKEGAEYYAYTPTGEDNFNSTDISGFDSGEGDDNYLYGVEFSSSGNMLYISSFGNGRTYNKDLEVGSADENGILYQISNFNSQNYDEIRLESVFMVDNKYPISAIPQYRYSIGALQLGIDGKIYHCFY